MAPQRLTFRLGQGELIHHAGDDFGQFIDGFFGGAYLSAATCLPDNGVRTPVSGLNDNVASTIAFFPHGAVVAVISPRRPPHPRVVPPHAPRAVRIATIEWPALIVDDSNIAEQ